jgi:hypothetical protein
MADSNSNSFHNFMVKRGNNQHQNSNSHFPDVESGRSVNKHWFKKIQNGEKVRSAWMRFFPPKKGALFCFCCTLFYQHCPNQRSKFNREWIYNLA